MKAVVILALVACATAKPQIFYGGFPWGGAVHYSAPTVTYASAPITYTAPTAAIIAPAFTKTQYHAQDEFGQASYGYAHPGQAHAAVRDALGNVRGSYAYIGADGKEVRTNYIADQNGFRVESNALPVAPAVPEAPVLVGPSPVQDTPEVAEAKAQHQKAIEEAQIRNAEADKQDAAEALAQGQAPQEIASAPAPEVAPEAVSEAVKSRRKRGLVYSSVVPSTHVVATHPVVYAQHPITYSAVVAPIPTVREATLTKVVNTPGHAVSYRVD